jgi:DNA-binding response OmpR family regulator
MDVLKSDARWRNIPILISAALKSNAEIALVRSRQAHDFLLKPLQTKAVVGKIKQALWPRPAGWG